MGPASRGGHIDSIASDVFEAAARSRPTVTWLGVNRFGLHQIRDRRMIALQTRINGRPRENDSPRPAPLINHSRLPAAVMSRAAFLDR